MISKADRRYSAVNSLVIPAFVIVALLTQIPVLVTLVLSVLKWVVVRPDLGITFTGLGNYLSVLSNMEFYGVIFNTVLMTVSTIFLCTALGLFFALLLNRKFFGVNVIRTLFIAPFFVMDAVTGIVWKTLMLHPSFGINGVLAGALGLPPIDFLGHFPMFTVILLVTWQWTPFFCLILLAGFQSIPEEILESARVDGAGWLRTIVQIKIPAIANHIEVAVMLGLIFILKIFGTIYVTTAGGPGTESTNLPYLVYRTGFYRWDEGKATAMAILTVILTLLAITAVFRFVRGRAKKVEA